MIDILQKSGKINISADEIHYANQIKNKNGKYCGEKLAFGVFRQHPLAFRLFLEDEMKKCTKCKIIKEVSEFSIRRDRKSGRMSHCKKCINTYSLAGNKRRHEIRKKKFGGLYSVWTTMKRRCYSLRATGYKRYGGRGIIVCREWRNSFLSFYKWTIKNGHRKGLTIDRKDNDGNYCPENCRFITKKENSRYKKSTILNIEKVKKVKRLLNEGKLFQWEIAKMFNVIKQNISHINTEKRWADVKI